MATSIAGAVVELKDQVQQFLSIPFVAGLAREMGLSWRQTPLALPNLVAWFARQIVGGNLSMPELARLAGSCFTPEAYCLARGRLPGELLKKLLRCVCDLGDREARDAAQRLWKGHRLGHMDGSTFSMADNLEWQEHFAGVRLSGGSCPVPVRRRQRHD